MQIQLGRIVEADVTKMKNEKQRFAMRCGVEVYYRSKREGERPTPKDERRSSCLLGKVLPHN